MSKSDVVLTDGVLHCTGAKVPDLSSFVTSGARHLRLDRTVKRAPELAAFLDACASLRALTLHHPSLLDPAPASASVEALDLASSSLDTLDFLTGFPELRRLSLGARGTRVRDFTALRHVPRLERLHAPAHLAGTLKPLRELEHLEEYVAPKTKALASLDGLDGCPKLRHVDANQSPVTSLTALGGSTKLRALKIRGTKVASLEPLYGADALETLFAERTKVRSLDGIAEGLPRLRLLWLHNTAITDLTPLAGLRSLLELDLGGLDVRDFAPLGSLRSVEHLVLDGTRFSDLGLLESLPNLVSVRLAGTKVRDRDPRAVKLDRHLVAKHGRGGGLSFDARTGLSRLETGRAPCVHGDLQHDEDHASG